VTFPAGRLHARDVALTFLPHVAFRRSAVIFLCLASAERGGAGQSGYIHIAFAFQGLTNVNPEDLHSLLLQELGDEIRRRREPEHLYTAAAVGAFGAVAWGVATIATVQNANMSPVYLHPAIVAAVGCILLAFALIAKVVREHRRYARLRREQIRIANWLADACSGSFHHQLPPGLQNGATAGCGYLGSILVIVSSAGLAAAFCVSVWLWSTSRNTQEPTNRPDMPNKALQQNRDDVLRN
jgi:hypothetical protein